MIRPPLASAPLITQIELALTTLEITTMIVDLSITLITRGTEPDSRTALERLLLKSTTIPEDPEPWGET